MRCHILLSHGGEGMDGVLLTLTCLMEPSAFELRVQFGDEAKPVLSFLCPVQRFSSPPALIGLLTWFRKANLTQTHFC